MAVAPGLASVVLLALVVFVAVALAALADVADASTSVGCIASVLTRPATVSMAVRSAGTERSVVGTTAVRPWMSVVAKVVEKARCKST
jgi:hypothetical protein